MEETRIVNNPLPLFSSAPRNRLGALCAAFALACGPASAGPASQPQPKVSFRYEEVLPATAPAPRGLIVHVEIAPGWHINSEAPLDEFLVPTKLEVEAEGLVFGKPVFPAPEKKHSDVMGGDVLLLSGDFDVAVPVSRKPSEGKPPLPTKNGPNPRTRVTLHYQSCNDSMCYPPKSVTAEM